MSTNNSTNEAAVLTAEFPRAMRGYSPLAVDDFIRQVGERLNIMQAQLDEQTTAAETQTQQIEKLTRALESANSIIGSFSEKETAIASAMVAMEQRRVSVERELENARKISRMEADQQIEAARILSERQIDDARSQVERIVEEARSGADMILNNARVESEAILNDARFNAETLMAHAEAVRLAEEERARQLCADYDATVKRIRRSIESQLALLPTPGETLASLSISGVAVTTSNGVRETVEAA